MRWAEVQVDYPTQWVLIEAIDAKTLDKKRIIEDMEVIDAFDNSKVAMQKYLELHKQYPDREMYVVHTSRSQLDIEELTWTGVRKK